MCAFPMVLGATLLRMCCLLHKQLIFYRRILCILILRVAQQRSYATNSHTKDMTKLVVL